MIKTVRVDISAGNPEAPVGDFVAFVGSAISFTLTNVPRELGKRVIERVAIEARTHQGVVRSFEGERVGSAWGVTIADDFFTHPCYIKNGIKVTAFGTGNDGEAETWTLGIGDITILENSVTIQPNDELQELVVVDGAYLANPKKGYFDLDGMRIYDGTRWVALGSGGGTGATVLTMNGGKVYNGTKEITQYSALLALVQAGGVVLLDTVAGTIAKQALFYPHMADDTAIRFDATGTLGVQVFTRSFAFTPKSGGGIAISRGGLTELITTSNFDWDNIRKKPQTNKVVRNFNREEVNNTAVMKSFKIPPYLKEQLAGKELRAIRMQGPTTATGSWDSTGVSLRLISEPFDIVIPSTGDIEVGKPVEFVGDVGFYIDTEDDYIHISSPLGQSKFGLVPVDSSLGYDIVVANGNHITNYAPFLEFVEKDGTVITTVVNDMMLSMVEAGAVRKLATNATQAQIISKVNELISKFGEV